MTFHFVARLCDTDQTVLDDSKKHNQPFELILGKTKSFSVFIIIIINLFNIF